MCRVASRIPYLALALLRCGARSTGESSLASLRHGEVSELAELSRTGFKSEEIATLRTKAIRPTEQRGGCLLIESNDGRDQDTPRSLRTAVLCR